MEKTLTGSINLTKLVFAKMKSKKGADCLVIPIDENILDTDDKGNVYIPIRIIYKSEQDQYKQNGFIAKAVSSKVYKAADDTEKDRLKQFTPILGNIKDWESTANIPEASNVDVEESDDLPF